jgi:hypothetical protein
VNDDNDVEYVVDYADGEADLLMMLKKCDLELIWKRRPQ